MNPAALKTNLGDLRKGGILIANIDNFEKKDYEMAGYDANPLDSEVLETHLPALQSADDEDRPRGRSKDSALDARRKWTAARTSSRWGWSTGCTAATWSRRSASCNEKFGTKPDIVEANTEALKAGWNYGETTDAFASSYKVDKAKLPPGKYKNIMRQQGHGLGPDDRAKLSGKDLFLGSYPITPASDILHELSKYKNFGVRTFQAEDEIAAICSAIGAAYGGHMAITTSSGPGIALKGEAIGLAVMLELPLLVINIQRGGPSTGLPTKTEQADLFQAIVRPQRRIARCR